MRMLTQCSSCLATLGFGTESRWDSRRVRKRGAKSRARFGCGQSQRDCGLQPKVGVERLPWVHLKMETTPTALRPASRDFAPTGLEIGLGRVATKIPLLTELRQREDPKQCFEPTNAAGHSVRLGNYNFFGLGFLSWPNVGIQTRIKK